ncbi:MAG TPA: mannosyltransferase family protein [Candidatus Binatia bacterium]|nr:mannosyltransferase family protein [Candidatus Binatia bacterium]
MTRTGLLPSRPTLLAFLLSRAIVLVAAVAAETVVARNPRLTIGADAPILRSLTAWDGWWYLGIARDGYQAVPLFDGYTNLAFWPLYPMVVRFLSLPWPALDGLVAVVVSNLAFLVALSTVEALGRVVVGEARAVRGASLLALSPFGFVFSMAYPESLFLLFGAGACFAAERGRWPAAGLLLALAALDRPNALVLLPTLVVIGLRGLERTERHRLAWLLPAPAVAVAFLGFTALLAGRPDAYLEAQAAWGRGGIGSTGETLGASLDLIRGAQLATFLAGVYLLVFVRPDRLPGPYVAWIVAALGLVFASGNLVSVGRHLTVVVPYFWLLAGRGSWLGRVAWPIASAVLLFAFALVNFAGWYVP